MVQPAASQVIKQQPSLNGRKRVSREKKKRRIWKIISLYTIVVFAGVVSSFLLWFYFTPSGSQMRYLTVDTLITSQHRDLAKYLIGSNALKRRVDAYWERFNTIANEPVTVQAIIPVVPEKKSRPLVDIKPISGTGFKGFLMTISDPKKVRIVVPDEYGKGEKVTSMIKRTGAIAGVNGGGFIDPEWKGNGFQPEGIVMSSGKIFYRDVGMNTMIHVVGIDKDGQMVAGRFTPTQLLNRGMSEAVSFAPRFIVNGLGQIKNEADGWGIAPRTSMAQKQDGSIMFAVIDGRQPGYSIGASLYDVQKIFLENGAIIAANLDGGASTVLVKENQIINRPSSQYGERYLPTAWLVFDNPSAAYINNIWEGVDISKINPSKW
jgi:exopolysaccharide biosynthesis protein